MIDFEYLNKVEFFAWAQRIFSILNENMTKIAPTGNTPEEDFKNWSCCAIEALKKQERQIILIKDNDVLVGFFQYSVEGDTFSMEEIQFESRYQGTGIFRALYGFVLKNIKFDLKYVRANASTENEKSMAILEKLGLKKMGLNKNGRSYQFKGDFIDLLRWYE